MDRRFRSIATVLSVTALTIVDLLIILAYELPSPGEVRESLLDYRLVTRRTPSAIRPLAEEPGSESQSSAPPPSPTPAPTPEEQIARYLIDRVLLENDAPPRVCENLEYAAPTAVTDRKTLEEALLAVANGEAGTNPYVESVIAPLEVALQNPSVTELVTQVGNAKAAGSDYLAPEQLNALMARASSDLSANKAELERVAMHAYHLYVLARALSLNPDLATNPDTIEFCNLLQNAISDSGEGPAFALQSEKAAMLRFLAFAGIAPDQVQYDPDLSAAIKFEANSSALELKIPWLEKVFPAYDPKAREAGIPGASIPFFTPTPTPIPASTPPSTATPR